MSSFDLSSDEENPADPPEPRLYNRSHAAAAAFLYSAATTGQLGSGHPEAPPATSRNALFLVFSTIPWRLLAVQLLWSACVLAAAFGLGNREHSTLSPLFWRSRLVVNPTVAYGVGWALFVLLGFFIREASVRYHDAQASIESAVAHIISLARQLRLVYPAGSWHPGDLDRIAAHLIAFPIGLKMSLREEREAEQLLPILHPDDVADIVAADSMHLHCTRVVRAYISAMEEDATSLFPLVAAESTFAGWGSRILVDNILDAIDESANVATRIARFRPSAGYVNHLRIFLYIWLMFLPLVLVESSGWFMILWTAVITYCVGMLFEIASALNEPFGHDAQDVKLNRLCAQLSLNVLVDYSGTPPSLSHVIRPNHVTPTWLEASQPIRKRYNTSTTIFFDKQSKATSFIASLRSTGNLLLHNLLSPVVLGPFLMFVAWVTIVVFLSWGFTRDRERESGDRWWTINIPVDTGMTGFVSLGVFLLLGFWMNDAYSRYWRALQIWQTEIKPIVEEVAFRLTMACHPGLWHARDHERILAHLAALPFTIKAHLRDTHDLSELKPILDPQDFASLSSAPNLPARCLDVIFGYIASVDRADKDTQTKENPTIGWVVYDLTFSLWSLEQSITECHTTRKFRISRSFTVHLSIFVSFWLGILPLSLAEYNGFFTFLFLLPIGYAVLNLLSIGLNLSDPFGTDREDIPLDLICNSITDTIRNMYHGTMECPKLYLTEESYDRSSFIPGALGSEPEHSVEADAITIDDTDITSDGELKSGYRQQKGPDHTAAQEKIELTVLSLLKSAFQQLPSVPLIPQIVMTIWSVTAVFLSWGLSRMWEGQNRGECRAWCSPIDVDGSELANLGFALFMLLSFRASDAISRYEEGAQLLYDFKLQLRSLTIDTLYFYRQGFLHKSDRERILAHLVQIPSVVRGILLDGEGSDPVTDQTLLCPEDRTRLDQANDPFEHLVRTVETYLLVADMLDRSDVVSNQRNDIPRTYTLNGLMSVGSLRKIWAKVISVKSFPVISRYSNHQYLFTGLWLGLLPLYMTNQTGFFTILWSPLISYGVFALQSIAERLVDPFGNDDIDIPVADLMAKASEELIIAADSTGWDSYLNTRGSPVDEYPRRGAKIKNGYVTEENSFAHFEAHESDVKNFGLSRPPKFFSGNRQKPKPTLLLHLVHSVPWGALFGIVAWTAIACVISFVARDRTVSDVRWWKSGFSISHNVATYISFATFMLLGFYIQAAFRRYQRAGEVWGDNLRSSCHSLAVQFHNFFESGSIHEGDRERVIAHIAAIPLVLKHELRGSRDIREVKGILSLRDVARIQTASSMTTHLVDVIRAYYVEPQAHQDRLPSEPFKIGPRRMPINMQTKRLRSLLWTARFLSEFDIAPGFIILLHALLGIWFALLPFVLAEVSGWLTIFWVAIIAYGVLGMYTVASELQSPFGFDVNDLDLDRFADEIVEDVLFVQRHYKAGLNALVRETNIGAAWKTVSSNREKRSSLYPNDGTSKLKKLRTSFYLALHAVPAWQMAGTLLWATCCVAGAWGLSKLIEVPACTSDWFCTYVAVGDELKGFIGFALFLLLGFRLYDSHFRYVSALQIWQDGLLGKSRLVMNRLLQSYTPGFWHSGDIERLCAHMAAFGICTKVSLRDENLADEELLRQVFCEEDLERVVCAKEPVDYCADVIRGYLLSAERISMEDPKSHPCGGSNFSMILYTCSLLERTAFDCRQLVRVPLPFGYVQHLRIFLIIWLLFLPLGLVETTGWVTILWVVIIAYGVLGLQNWADELADPFGHDITDVPLDELCRWLVSDIQDSLTTFRTRGVEHIIRTDRPAFQACNDTVSNGLQER